MQEKVPRAKFASFGTRLNGLDQKLYEKMTASIMNWKMVMTVKTTSKTKKLS